MQVCQQDASVSDANVNLRPSIEHCSCQIFVVVQGMLKKDMKTVMSTIIRNMAFKLGACGNLNRNVLVLAAPYANRKDCLSAEP